MYLSMLIWLAGLVVFLGSLSPVLFPILLFLKANFLIIPLEEQDMEDNFGDRYIKYKQHVGRWL
jgi:protein-S-isoprenylcysteine O-methyltransferase Ste14